MAEPAPAPDPAYVDRLPPPVATEGTHAVAPDGRPVLVRPGMEQAATSAGYRLQTPDEFAAEELARTGGLTEQAKAFGENLASGATIGLSDVAASAVGGDEYRRARALRELAFPTSSMAGEITGMVAPALIPGGAGASVARVAAEGAEGASLLGRGARLAGSALRNSPMGFASRGGEALSELVGHELLPAVGITGESLAGRVASSGLKLAAGGAVEGAAAGAGSALSEAALAPGGDYDGLAQKLWAGAIHGAEFGALATGALGAGGELAAGVARKVGGSYTARKLLEDVANAKTLKSAGLSKADIATIAAKNPEHVGELASAVRSADEVTWLDSAAGRSKHLGEAEKNAEQVVDKMRAGLDEIKAPGDGVDVSGVLGRYEKVAQDLGAVAKPAEAEELAATIAKLREAAPEGERLSFDAAHKLRNTLDDELTKYKGSRPPGAKPDAFEQQITGLRNDIEREFRESADRVSQNATPEFRAQYEAAKSRQAALTEVAELSRGRLAAESGDQNLGSMLAGAIGLTSLGPKGLLLAAAHKAMRSAQADHIVGKLAAELTGLDNRIAQSMGKWAETSRKAAIEPATLSRYTGGARSTATSTYDAASQAQSQHERVAKYFTKLAAVGREANAPPGTLVHIPDSPKTQEAAENVRRRQAQWLLDQAPASGTRIANPVLARLNRQVPPNPSEVAQWMVKVKTIEDPKSALKAFQEGKLTPAHVAALEQSPVLLEKFRQAAMDQVTDKNVDISYDARMQLGVLLGVVTDPSLRPESIALSQQTYTAMRQEAAQTQSQPSAPSAPGKAPRGTASRVDELEEGAPS